MSSTNEIQPSEPKHSDSFALAESGEHQSLDRTLTEIRSGRRLEKIVASIDNFLQSQVSRLEAALDECQQAEENDKIVQAILADFEREKQEWEDQRQAEIFRLNEASDQLINAWQQLEDERRNWLDKR